MFADDPTVADELALFGRVVKVKLLVYFYRRRGTSDDC